MTVKIMKGAILSILDQESKTAHKWNIIGRPYQHGQLEQRLNTTFTPEDRALASTAFEQLKVDGFVQPTFSDIADPENWVTITDLGKQFLKSGLRDAIDIHLAEIGEHLMELRAGMWDASSRTSPDAARQAAHSARELKIKFSTKARRPNARHGRRGSGISSGSTAPLTRASRLLMSRLLMQSLSLS